MMLVRIVKRMVLFFYENNVIKKDDMEIYEYGLELLLSSILQIIAVLLISVVVGKLLVTIMFLLAFCTLRTFAGGYHAETHFKCFIILLFVYSTFLALIFFLNQDAMRIAAIVFSSFSTILVFVWAPIDSENKPLTSDEKNRYRKISISIIFVQTLLIITMALFNIQIMFSVSFGQLATASSLAVVKIINKGSRQNESIKISVN